MVSERAHEVVAVGILRRVGGDVLAVGEAHEVGKVLGGVLSVGTLHDAHGAVRAVGLADAGGVGGRLPALVGHRVVGQLAHDVPELGSVA